MNRTILIACAVASTCWASAVNLLSTGFETSQGYNLGSVVGQQQWTQQGSDANLTGRVVEINPFEGTRSFEIDANEIIGAAWWYKPVNFDVGTSSNKVVRVTWRQRVSAPTGTPDFTNTSAFGVLAYDNLGVFINGLYFDNYDARLFYYDDAIDDWSQLGDTVSRNAYAGLGMTVNYADGTVRYWINDEIQGESSKIQPGTTSIFGDADFHVRFATTDKAHFDNLRIESYPVGTIAGRVVRSDHVGPLSRPVIVEIRNIGSTTVLETILVTPDSNNLIEIQTARVGTFDLSFRTLTHLRKVVPNVALSGHGFYSVDVTLVNGDVDGDNSVTVFDYGLLSDAFDSVEGGANWLAAADLDADGSVTVFDYGILSNSFDQSGDN